MRHIRRGRRAARDADKLPFSGLLKCECNPEERGRGTGSGSLIPGREDFRCIRSSSADLLSSGDCPDCLPWPVNPASACLASLSTSSSAAITVSPAFWTTPTAELGATCYGKLCSGPDAASKPTCLTGGGELNPIYARDRRSIGLPLGPVAMSAVVTTAPRC